MIIKNASKFSLSSILLFACMFLHLFVSFNQLNACALCSQKKEAAHVTIDGKISDSSLHSLTIEYEFNDTFSKGVTTKYDENGTDAIESSEFTTISRIFYDYFKKSGYFIRVKNYKTGSNRKAAKPLDLEYSDTKLEFRDGLLVFSFTIDNTIPLHKDSTVYFLFKDYNFYFEFAVIELRLDPSDAVYEIKDNTVTLSPYTSVKKSFGSETNTEVSIEGIGKVLGSGILFLSEELSRQISQAKSSPCNLFFFAVFSFLFGMVHSLLPGHGKIVISSYVFSGNKNTVKIILLCLAVPVIHITTSLLLALFTEKMLKMVAVRLFSNYSVAIILITAAALIAISLYLFIQKKKHRHHHTCGCHSCGTTSSDIGIILAVGAMPCITTFSVLLFIVTQNYTGLALFSGLLMSLGMGIVLLAAAFFSRFIKSQIESRMKRLVPVLEYMSIFILFLFGIYLVLSISINM